MKFLKKIVIKNFESHEDTEIDFDEGLTFLTGTSDAGKSSVIRAIRWVSENRPSGDSFRSHWGGDTSVQFVFSNGDSVTRVKTNSKNLYLVNGTPFEGFGTKVPDPVKEILCFSDLTIQGQHDPYFMLSMSPGKRIEKLNETVNLDLIDKSGKIARKKIRDSKRKKEELETEIDDAVSDIENYSPAVKASSILKTAGRHKERLDDVLYEKQIAKELASSFNKINYSLDECVSAMENYGGIVEKLKEKMEMISITVSKKTELGHLMDKIENAQEGAIDYDSIQMEEILNKLKKLFGKIKERETTLNAVEDLVEKSYAYEKKLNELDDEIEAIEEEIGGLPACPFCGSELN